jgi:hypothetical protein
MGVESLLEFTGSKGDLLLEFGGVTSLFVGELGSKHMLGIAF